MRGGDILICSCCALFLGVMAAPTGLYIGVWKLVTGKDAAAWVQAVGSVLAIFVAIGIAAWQNHQARHDAITVERKRDVIKLEAAYAAIAEGATAACNIYDTCIDQVRPFNSVSKRIMLEEALESIKRLSASDAPDPKVVLNLVLAKLQVSQLVPVMQDFAAHAEEDEFTLLQIEFIKQRALRLLELANELGDILPEGRRPEHIGLDDLKRLG